ncbi:hypothetical protein K445DRAFT_12121 [Daldinia sp. EC12]|nr:hypothetical protein F4774DRAFT_426529 [Daldinia eschscholtzii]OTB15356.1 hypothetical protein K445DRAFT_12121 [Daldinia sp. EC12]
MDHPSVILKSARDITTRPEFSETERARFEKWATPFTRVAIALSSWLPEVDTAALVEFVEFPRIQLAFAKIRGEYLSKRAIYKPGDIDYYVVTRAVEMFRMFPEGQHVATKSSGLRPREACHHIMTFMQEVYISTVVERHDLSIRPFLLPGEPHRIPILAGVFAAYILIRNETHLSAQAQLGAYPKWQARHKPRGLEEASRRLLYLSYKNADEFRTQGDHSAAGKLETFMEQVMEMVAGPWVPKWKGIEPKEEEKDLEGLYEYE